MKRALFGELQLALYSRAWELSHPGDLVVGAGITTLGFDSNHYIEVSGLAPSRVFEGSFGEATTLTRDMFRFADEGPDTKSDYFRAWLTHRMTVASSVVHNANLGLYNPTPIHLSVVIAECPVCVTKVNMEDIRNDSTQLGQRLALNLDSHIAVDAGAGQEKPELSLARDPTLPLRRQRATEYFQCRKDLEEYHSVVKAIRMNLRTQASGRDSSQGRLYYSHSQI